MMDILQSLLYRKTTVKDREIVKVKKEYSIDTIEVTSKDLSCYISITQRYGKNCFKFSKEINLSKLKTKQEKLNKTNIRISLEANEKDYYYLRVHILYNYSSLTSYPLTFSLKEDEFYKQMEVFIDSIHMDNDHLFIQCLLGEKFLSYLLDILTLKDMEMMSEDLIYTDLLQYIVKRNRPKLIDIPF